MVKRVAQLDAVFHALSDPTRRSMVSRLARGSVTVGELSEPLAMTKPAVTKHLKVLERAGLLRRKIEGRVHHCAIDPAPLSSAQKWVAQVQAFWDARFDDLADYLDTLQNKKNKKRKTR